MLSKQELNEHRFWIFIGSAAASFSLMGFLLSAHYLEIVTALGVVAYSAASSVIERSRHVPSYNAGLAALKWAALIGSCLLLMWLCALASWLIS